MTDFLLLCLWLLVAYAGQIIIAIGSGCVLAYCIAAAFSTLFLAAGSRRH